MCEKNKHARWGVSSDVGACQLKSLALTVQAPHFVTAPLLCQTFTISLPSTDQIKLEPELPYTDTNTLIQHLNQKNSNGRHKKTHIHSHTINKQGKSSKRISYTSQILSLQIKSGFYFWLTAFKGQKRLLKYICWVGGWRWMTQHFKLNLSRFLSWQADVFKSSNI